LPQLPKKQEKKEEPKEADKEKEKEEKEIDKEKEKPKGKEKEKIKDKNKDDDKAKDKDAGFLYEGNPRTMVCFAGPEWQARLPRQQELAAAWGRRARMGP
jgi:hypothetical protein